MRDEGSKHLLGEDRLGARIGMRVYIRIVRSA
jgi:hypothetical protein